LTEQELVKRAQAGDVSAFEKLVRRYDREVLALALHMVRNPEDAKDIYQEAFLKAFQALPGFQLKSQFSTWLYRIVVNVCLSFHRRRKPLVSDEDLWERPAEDAPDPEAQLLNRELQERIDELVQGLPPRQRLAFVLRHYQERRISEISEIMGCSEGAVKNYLFRAHEKLRKGLGPYLECG